MKSIVSFLLLLLAVCVEAHAQNTPLFKKGELSTTKTHTGKVWLGELNKADSVIDCNISTATFEPGAKLDWHIHPAGQVLMITDGTGYYQEKGKQIQVVHQGDIIQCLPGIPHWHGASPGSEFTYIAVSTKGATNETIWLQRVTDAEYRGVKQ